MQTVKGAQFLNINFLSALFAAAAVAVVFEAVIVFFCMYVYTHHYNHINLALAFKFYI